MTCVHAANPPTGEMVLYQHSFEGRSLSINSSIPILSSDWNNQVTSVLVVSGEWQLCEDSNYQGTCITLTAGAYDWVPAQGLANDALSSVRLLGGAASPDHATLVPFLRVWPSL